MRLFVCRHRRSSGFTSIELLVALAVAAILLGVAVPSLRVFSANNHVVSASNSIVSGLNFARFTAITQGEDITICPSENGTSCSDNHWHSNWIVFIDSDGNSVPAATEILKTAAIDAGVEATGSGTPIVFTPTGRTTLGSDAVITSCFEDSDVPARCIDITVSAFGSIRASNKEVPSETES